MCLVMLSVLHMLLLDDLMSLPRFCFVLFKYKQMLDWNTSSNADEMNIRNGLFIISAAVFTQRSHKPSIQVFFFI